MDGNQNAGRMTKKKVHKRLKLILFTGVAGAGRTSALAALADMGFSALDNPPIRLLGRVVDDLVANGVENGVAIGIDVRSSGFSTGALVEAIRDLNAREDAQLTVVFLDCADAELLRRFSETRRRHPITDAQSVQGAIARERETLALLREESDITLDTSDFSLTALRAELQSRFSEQRDGAMSITLASFGMKKGLPRQADIVFDVRCLSNPYWVPELREGTGLDMPVAEFVKNSEGYEALFERFRDLLLAALPLYAKEGKSYLSVAIGCTGGRHRSVAFVEAMAAALNEESFKVATRHRDLPAHLAHPTQKRSA